MRGLLPRQGWTFKVGHSERGRGLTLVRHRSGLRKRIRVVNRHSFVVIGYRWSLIIELHPQGCDARTA